LRLGPWAGGGTSRLAEVEDGLGGGEVLDVPVLDEGGARGVGGEGRVAGSLILVLYRVLQTVRSEQASLLRLDLRPPTGEVLRLVKVVLVILERSVWSDSEILPGLARLWGGFIRSTVSLVLFLLPRLLPLLIGVL